MDSESRVPMIECHHVTKRYNQDNGIEDIHFRVEKGECLALCGGNGAGKSSIIKLLVGILTPDSGYVRLAGKSVVENEMAYKRLFGYMPDSMVFPKSLSGREILRFYSHLHGLSKADADHALERVGLTKDAHKKVSQYSKGMQQRLVFAQSLLANPPILILDEPTNGLDPIWVVRLKQWIRELKQQGTTIVLSSHIMQDVEELATSVAFIHGGRMIVHEPIASLCNKDGQYTRLEEVFFRTIQHGAETNR